MNINLDNKMQLLILFILASSLVCIAQSIITTGIVYLMNAVRLYSLSFIALGINFLYIFYAQDIQKDKLANIIQILEGLIFH